MMDQLVISLILMQVVNINATFFKLQPLKCEDFLRFSDLYYCKLKIFWLFINGRIKQAIGGRRLGL